MMEHTKEPWSYDYEPGYCGELIGTDGTMVCSFADEPNEANARRIVACVNACTDIPTAMLDRALPGTIAKNIVGSIMQTAEIEQLTAQRDELQAELNGIKQNIAFAATCNHIARMEQAEKQRDELREQLAEAQLQIEEFEAEELRVAENNYKAGHQSALKAVQAELEGWKLVPESLAYALRDWSGAEPSQSVLARKVEAWVAATAEPAPKKDYTKWEPLLTADEPLGWYDPVEQCLIADMTLEPNEVRDRSLPVQLAAENADLVNQRDEALAKLELANQEIELLKAGVAGAELRCEELHNRLR
jgi:hypothetical protein